MISLQFSGTRWNSSGRQSPWLPHRWKGTHLKASANAVFWNKTGTLAQGVLYVDNRGSSDPRARRARIGSVQGGPGPRGTSRHYLSSRPTAERLASPVILPVIFESGERRWREA